MSSPKHRRLLPASEKEKVRQPSISSSNPEQTPTSKLSKGKGLSRISTACEACKKRKSRCTGPPAPCSLCRSLGTECIIDETLDQRRNKASTTRLMESTTEQRELLSSMVQSLRYSEWDEAEELISAIRNNLPSDDVAAILQRNVGFLRQRGVIEPVAIGDLQLAFSGSQASGVDDELGDAGSSEQDERMAGYEAEQQGREEAMQGHRYIRQEHQQRQALPDQLKTYERWIHLFGTWPNVAADRQLEEAHGYGQVAGAQAGRWDQGLWRKMSTIGLSPAEESQLSQHSAEGESVSVRINWHPALQIQSAGEEESPGPRIALVPAEVTKLQEVTELITAQESGETGRWVEIVNSIPDLTDGSDEDGSLEPSYRFESARYPMHTVQTVTAFEDSPLSRVITDYREAARAVIHQGIPPIDILGHHGVEVELFFRDRTSEDKYSVGNWASELWRSFHDWDIYVRLGMCLSMTYMMRWMLVPTAKRYADIPDILKPRPMQRVIAHHAAIDFLPLPELREGLIRNFQDFMTALPAAKLSVNWRREMDEAVIRDESYNCLRLTEAFEKHAIDPGNWSVGASILKTFPELKGTIKLDTGH